MKHYWMIDGNNNIFRTLKDVKNYIWIAYTPDECKKYLNGNNICHVINDEVTTVVEINVNESGKISYSKPSKLNWWEK